MSKWATKIIKVINFNLPVCGSASGCAELATEVLEVLVDPKGKRSVKIDDFSVFNIFRMIEEKNN